MNLKLSMSELPKQSEGSYAYRDIDYSKLSTSTVQYELYQPPKYVGYYQLGGQFGLRISFAKKPCWFHRKMMKLCLGWEWGDGSPF